MDKLTTALFAVILAASISSFAAAQINEEHTEAPEVGAEIWNNSPPLTLSGLRGKVVLIDFWEYTSINCIRTFPHLRRWNRLYAPLGLVVIGVHTPEFAFAKNPQRVADAGEQVERQRPTRCWWSASNRRFEGLVGDVLRVE